MPYALVLVWVPSYGSAMLLGRTFGSPRGLAGRLSTVLGARRAEAGHLGALSGVPKGPTVDGTILQVKTL